MADTLLVFCYFSKKNFKIRNRSKLRSKNWKYLSNVAQRYFDYTNSIRDSRPVATFRHEEAVASSFLVV